MIVERFGQEITTSERAAMLLPLISDLERQQNLDAAIDSSVSLKYQSTLVLGRDVSGESIRSVLLALYVVRSMVAEQPQSGPSAGTYRLVPGREQYVPQIEETGRAALPQLRRDAIRAITALPSAATLPATLPIRNIVREPYTIAERGIPTWFWLALVGAAVIFLLRR